jgi:hypothetical protein
MISVTKIASDRQLWNRPKPAARGRSDNRPAVSDTPHESESCLFTGPPGKRGEANQIGKEDSPRKSSEDLSEFRHTFPRAKLRFARARKIGFVLQFVLCLASRLDHWNAAHFGPVVGASEGNVF